MSRWAWGSVWGAVPEMNGQPCGAGSTETVLQMGSHTGSREGTSHSRSREAWQREKVRKDISHSQESYPTPGLLFRRCYLVRCEVTGPRRQSSLSLLPVGVFGNPVNDSVGMAKAISVLQESKLRLREVPGQPNAGRCVSESRTLPPAPGYLLRACGER